MPAQKTWKTALCCQDDIKQAVHNSHVIGRKPSKLIANSPKNELRSTRWRSCSRCSKSFRDVIQGNTRVIPSTDIRSPESLRNRGYAHDTKFLSTIPNYYNHQPGTTGVPLNRIEGSRASSSTPDSVLPDRTLSDICLLNACSSTVLCNKCKVQAMVNRNAASQLTVSELKDGDSARNVVEIIFRTSWAKDDTLYATIEKVIKVNNDPKVLAKFEEHRAAVKAKASNLSTNNKKHSRCIADGNELLRFHCATMSCTPDTTGYFSSCTLPSCNLCNILRLGFLQKGVHSAASSRKAHDNASALQQQQQQQPGEGNEKRGMIICRVIGGRVKIRTTQQVDSESDAAAPVHGFDSIADADQEGASTVMEDLLVLDSNAILACFVVIYNYSLLHTKILE